MPTQKKMVKTKGKAKAKAKGRIVQMIKPYQVVRPKRKERVPAFPMKRPHLYRVSAIVFSTEAGAESLKKQYPVLRDNWRNERITYNFPTNIICLILTSNGSQDFYG